MIGFFYIRWCGIQIIIKFLCLGDVWRLDIMGTLECLLIRRITIWDLLKNL